CHTRPGRGFRWRRWSDGPAPRRRRVPAPLAGVGPTRSDRFPARATPARAPWGVLRALRDRTVVPANLGPESRPTGEPSRATTRVAGVADRRARTARHPRPLSRWR